MGYQTDDNYEYFKIENDTLNGTLKEGDEWCFSLEDDKWFLVKDSEVGKLFSTYLRGVIVRRRRPVNVNKFDFISQMEPAYE